jgi:hypothetical protein
MANDIRRRGVAGWQRVTTGVLTAAVVAAIALCMPALAAAQPAHAQGPNLGTSVIGTQDRQLAANGGDGTYTWTLIAGALPPGVSLRTDVPSFYPANADAGLMGVATTPGDYAFTLRVSSAGQSADRAYTWRITALTFGDSSPFPDAFVGVPYSKQLTAANPAGPVTFTPTSLPPGMTLSAAGLLGGAPTTAGFYNVGFTIADGVDTTGHGRSISVYAVTITNDGTLPNATQAVPYNTTLTAAGGTAPYTFAACPGNTIGTTCAPGLVALPSGLVLTTDGVISGTPTSGASKFAFTVTATDAASRSYSKLMSIPVVGDPPTLPRVNPYGDRFDDGPVGGTFSNGVSVFNGGSAPFEWSALGLPPGLAIRTGSRIARDYITPGDAEVWGVPTTPGDYLVEVTVTDADGVTSTNTYPLRISLMQLQSSLSNGTIGVPYSSTMRVLGGRPPYTAQMIGGRLPAGLAFNPATLTVSGTPLENSQSTSSFDPLFRFTDADGNVFERHSYFSVAGTTSTIAISTGSDLGRRVPGSFTSITLTACCLPSFTWSLSSGTLPPGMSLSSAGFLSGTPSTEGTYTFILSASDPLNPANAAFRAFTLRINPQSVATNLPSVANVDGGLNVQLAATGGTGPFTWRVVPYTYPPPGLTLDASGLLSGTFTASGQYNFSVEVTDSVGRVTTRGYTISVYPEGVSPPLNITNLSPSGTFFNRNVGTFTLELFTTGGQPPYTYSMTPGATAVPGMRVQSGLPQPTGFSNTGGFLGVIAEPGVYTTSVRVTDALGDFLDRGITITVTSIAQLSQPPLPRTSVGDPYSFQLMAFGGSGDYSWSVINSAMPAGLALSPAGLISGTPTAPSAGTITVRLQDNISFELNDVTYTLTVDAYPITTPGVLPRATQSTAYAQQLSAPGCGAGCVWSTTAVLPAGLTLSASGLLSGTPTGTFNGSFFVTVTGSNGTAQRLFALQIANANLQALAITTTTVGPTVVGALTGTGLFAFGGSPPYSWSVVAGTLPPGITLQSPGELVGQNLVPGLFHLAGRAMEVGLFTFTAEVTDSAGATASRQFTWNISALSFQTTSLPLTSALQNNPLVFDQPYQQQLLVIGGTEPYTFVNTQPMPPGLALSAGGLVTGTPMFTGTVSVLIQATDAAGNLNINNHTFTASSGTPVALGFSTGAAQTVQYGFGTSINVTPTGGTGPYTVTPLTPLPAGLSLLSGESLVSAAAGSFVVAGIPQGPGVSSFTLRAMDALGNIGVRTYTYAVASFTIFNSTLGDGSVGVPYSQALVTWPTAGGVTWSVSQTSNLPPGMTLSPAGVLGGTPTMAGTFSFTLTGIDAAGTTINTTPTLRISPLSIADPRILPQAAIVGEPFMYAFTGGPGGVWSATGLPAGLTMSGAGVLTGTPTGAGASTVLVTLTDGVVPFVRRFTLFSRLPNPSVLTSNPINAQLADAALNQSLSVTLNANGGVPPYEWMLTSGALPPGLQLIRAGADLPTFPPGVTILAGAPTAPGNYVFDLTLSDAAGAMVQRRFTLKVTSTAIIGGVRTATVGVAYAQRFTGVGGTPPYTFTIEPNSLTVDVLPPGMTFSPDGLMSGTPTSTGVHNMLMRATDAAGQTFARNATLNVDNPLGLRITNANPPDAWVGLARTLNLQTNGTSTYTWTLESGMLPPGFGVINGPTPQVGGPASVPGTYVFTLRATDNANAANTALHTFTFRASPMQIVSPPVRNFFVDYPSAQIGTPYSFTVRVAGGTGPYTWTVSPFTPLPDGLTLSAAGVLSGTPQVIGNYGIALIVSDAAGNTLNVPSLNLAVTPAGVSPPLIRVGTTTVRDAAVGAPYLESLADTARFLRGGTPPFSVALHGGSTLPSGLSLLPGASGLSTLLAGIPTTAGVYPFSLVFTDATGQSLTVAFTQNVSNIAVSPTDLPPGRVGMFYSQSLLPSGGTAPYTWSMATTSDFPPGLTLNAAGLLSGTPTAPGNFRLLFAVADAAANTRTVTLLMTVDNAAGQAPAFTVTPDPIQIYYEQGSPAPAPLPVTFGSTSGSLPFTAIVTGLAGTNLSGGGGNTSSPLMLNVNPGALPIGTYTGVVAAVAPSSMNGFDAVPVTVTVAAAPPCTYTLQAQAASMPAIGGIGGFAVQAGPGCAWLATGPPPAQLQITSPVAGSGNGNITYNVLPNGAANPRNLTIRVGGQQHNITQFGSVCSYAINPSRLAVPAGGGMATIAITPGDASCADWQAVGFGATPANGTYQDQSTVVTIPPNVSALPQTFTATIAGRMLTVNQAGVGCTTALSPYNASSPFAGGQGSVGVTIPAGCDYETTSNANWISVISGGAGNVSGTLVYSVEPNSTTVSRMGTLSIDGQTFQVTQDPLPCSVTVNTSGLGSPFGPSPTAGLIGITANGPNCSWTASSGVSWATVAPLGGTGNGSVGVTVLSNAASTEPRSGSLSIAGQTIGITQAGTTCSYGLQSAAGSVPAAGGTGTVGVVAANVCNWASASNDPSWLTITSSGTGGSSDVRFTALANPTATPRMGTLTIAGLTYTVSQAGAPCQYTLPSSNVTVASGAVAGDFDFSTTFAGCTPQAVSYAGWIDVTTMFDGASGQVDFSVEANPSTFNRVGTIRLGEQIFTLTQTGGACGFSLNANSASFGPPGDMRSVLGSPSALGCVPAVGTDQPSFVTLGNLFGPVSNIFTLEFTISPFASLTPTTRFGRITFGGQILSIKQTSY